MKVHNQYNQQNQLVARICWLARCHKGHSGGSSGTVVKNDRTVCYMSCKRNRREWEVQGLVFCTSIPFTFSAQSGHCTEQTADQFPSHTSSFTNTQTHLPSFSLPLVLKLPLFTFASTPVSLMCFISLPFPLFSLLVRYICGVKKVIKSHYME